jgi:lycopene beta-cyclase
MQSLLRSKFFKANGISIPSKLSSTRINTNIFDKNLAHTENGSILTLDNGDVVKCKVLIDTSGLESKLVCKEDPMYARANRKSIPVGFQIAYGFIAHVDSLGPYDKDAMTLFDYKTNHLEGEQLIDATNRPTFMYAMPLGKLPDGKYRVIYEETSLVGKD